MEQTRHFTSAAERRAAMRHLMLNDHGLLRVFWTHEHEIAPGVWRSNQPSPKRIGSWAKRGIRSVLSLRGQHSNKPIGRLEQDVCADHGLALHLAEIPARHAASTGHLKALLDVFETVEKPFVMHCKSGIDRTGLAAFLYLVAQTDTPPTEARQQLSFKYLHVRHSAHGILDEMADAYVQAHAETGLAVRQWIETDYDPDALMKRYLEHKGAA